MDTQQTYKCDACERYAPLNEMVWYEEDGCEV